MKLTAAWAARADLSAIDKGLSKDEALERASELMNRLREQSVPAPEATLDDAAIDVLQGACQLVAEASAPDPEATLADAENLYRFIESATWPEPDFDERSELLARCAFMGWRIARRASSPRKTVEWLRRSVSAAGVAPIRSAIDAILSTPVTVREQKTEGFGLEDPELLHFVCEVLRSRYNTSPTSVRGDAEFFYQFLDQPTRKIGLYDEKEYFLGELSLIAGTACRLLFRREEAGHWFAEAESQYNLTTNREASLARLAYQRLALRAEERKFDEVLELAPRWFEAFARLELPDDALKSRFLQGAALREVGRAREAVQVFKKITQESEALGNLDLLAQAIGTLAQLYRVLGDLKEALTYARRALPLFRELNHRVGLAKLRWCIGDILREQGNLGEAADAYRAALSESEEIGTRNDSAAIHLVLAEVLVDLGFNEQAEREIRAALPIIEEEKMVPEGFAALALLQESLRRRQIDRQALRNLHGFFREGES